MSYAVFLQSSLNRYLLFGSLLVVFLAATWFAIQPVIAQAPFQASDGVNIFRLCASLMAAYTTTLVSVIFGTQLFLSRPLETPPQKGLIAYSIEGLMKGSLAAAASAGMMYIMTLRLLEGETMGFTVSVYALAVYIFALCCSTAYTLYRGLYAELYSS